MTTFPTNFSYYFWFPLLFHQAISALCLVSEQGEPAVVLCHLILAVTLVRHSYSTRVVRYFYFNFSTPKRAADVMELFE